MQVRERLRLADVGAGFAALDALAIGAVICDRAGRILFANRAAEAAAAGGAGIVLGDARRGIGALHGEETKALAYLIADVVDGGAGGGTTLSGEDGARLFVLVAPLPSRLADEPGRVLVTMRPAAAAPTFGCEILVRLFGLTPAEAALALALFAGRSVAEIMEGRGVTENTVRTQLASILRKTDTANQRDLVRLIGLLPPLR
jgi:DNA-binding CsgD family transcriptional regulator